jgi:ABC-type multidrug transport system fused ATPase/permease subunit
MLNWAKSRFSRTTIWKALSTLEPRERRLGVLAIAANIFLGLLDLVGVIAIGLVGTLAVTGVTTGQPTGSMTSILKMLNLDSLSFQSQVSVIAIVAACAFFTRTICSMIIARRTLHFLSRKAARISTSLLGRILDEEVSVIQNRSSGELMYILSAGINSITLGVVGLSFNFISDGVLLVVLFLGIVVVDPIVAFTSVLSFIMIGLVLYTSTRMRAKRIGEENAKFTILIQTQLTELLENFRENFVKNRIGYLEHQIDDSRKKLAGTLAEQQFLPNLSKYVIESAVIMLGLGVSALQFAINDAAHAVASLSIFLAAGSRLAPSVMRMQQNAIQIRGNLGMAEPALILLEKFPLASFKTREIPKLELDHLGFKGLIEVENLNFSYSGKYDFGLKDINLVINPGEQVAIVGPSGGGKTTLVDVILGILKPTSGSVQISGLNPSDCYAKWPGAVAYVPQEIRTNAVSLIENVGSGFPESEIDPQRVAELLKIAQLEGLIQDLEKRVSGSLNSLGSHLSGGQKQRVGIARALFTNPRIIVLDEATSALDGQTEQFISDSILGLKGQVTVLMIAHRLSSVRHADKVIYMDKGVVEAVGSMDEVRAIVPDFDVQAQLMGL